MVATPREGYIDAGVVAAPILVGDIDLVLLDAMQYAILHSMLRLWGGRFPNGYVQRVWDHRGYWHEFGFTPPTITEASWPASSPRPPASESRDATSTDASGAGAISATAP